MRNDITGIILCGGKSSRMQTNKALLKLDDKTVIEIVLGEMKKVFDEVIISANECDQLSFLNIPIIKDVLINRGPLSGIYSVLQESKTQKNFIVTCDLPLINAELIEYISKIKSDKEIIIPTINEIPQRLFGVYNKSLIKNIEEIFSLTETDKSVKGSIYELHERSSIELVEIANLPFYKEYMFCNMNTPEDYAIVKRIFENQ
jgi:molybdenum cofactor guanylyltransferase